MWDDSGKTVLTHPKLPKLPNVPGGLLGIGLLAILVIGLLVTSWYTVEPEEVGVVTRFGRYASTSDPGLHFKIPFGVDRVYKVPVQRQLKQEFGFRTVQPGVRSEFRTVDDEAIMLTGDLNSAVVEWVVQYRVADPYQFLFRVRNVQDTLHDLSEAVMRQVVGDRTVDEVLTVGRAEVATLVEQELQELANQYESGIEIEQVVLQDVNPPNQVKPSFNEVNQAEQERETLINQAQSEYNKVIPRAEGEAQETIQTAEGYAIDRVNRAQGEALRFTALYDEYRQAPEVTRRRIYLETLADVLPKLGGKVVLDEQLEGILPLLPLDGRLGGSREGEQ